MLGTRYLYVAILVAQICAGGSSRRCGSGGHRSNRLGSGSRLRLEASPDDRVRDGVVHPAQVRQTEWKEDDERWRNSEEEPDVDHGERPPLEDEDGDEDHHLLGRVAVSFHVGVEQVGRLFDRVPDRAVCDGHDAGRYDLHHAVKLTITLASHGPKIDQTPARID